MELSQSLTIGLLVPLAAIAIHWLARRWKLPKPPLRSTILGTALFLVFCRIDFSGQYRYLNASNELIVSYVVIRYLNWLLIECCPRLGLFKPVPNIVRDLFFWLIFAVVFLVEIKIYGGLNLVGLLTTSAVLTVVFGLALQDPLKDFFAGIAIQVDPPFRKGDWIEVGEASGIVLEMNLMDTTIRRSDNSTITIPNTKVMADRIRIFVAGEPVGNSFSVSLDYQFPPGQAIQFLASLIQANPMVLRNPAPRIWIGSYDDFSIRYDIIAFQNEVSTVAKNTLRTELLSSIWYALEREGRSFPYPVMELSRWKPIQATNDPASLLKEDKIVHLKNSWLFKGLAGDQLDCLVENVRFVRFAPGEVFVRQGDEGSTLYQIIRGQVEVLVGTPGKPLKSVAVIGADQILGEMSLLTGEPRAASLRAVDECLLLEVERRDLQPILNADPKLIEGLAELVADRRAGLEKLSTEEAETRERGILSMMRQLFA
jgi:small-conductance mechanosensitive channel/CRP-like cAMP-binding protein